MDNRFMRNVEFSSLGVSLVSSTILVAFCCSVSSAYPFLIFLCCSLVSKFASFLKLLALLFSKGGWFPFKGRPVSCPWCCGLVAHEILHRLPVDCVLKHVLNLKHPAGRVQHNVLDLSGSVGVVKFLIW